MSARQLILDIQHKLIVDLFAGGGGMSVAMEMAWGRSPDVAINHSDDALSMHRANHPQTRHFVADVFEVCPRAATQGRPVGWLHLSPDCTHHSQARGGQPRSGKIRALAWVGLRWAGQALPDVISLENVKQFRQWGPLVAKRDPATGRVMTLDMVTCPATGRKTHRVAEPGERVPVQNQYLVPDPRRAGQTYRRFVRCLEALGYVVDSRIICAADHGGHTTRERLFMIASRTGQPIAWPEPTHAKVPTDGQKRWRPAADCIDWSTPCPSIFERARPLAPATLKRIARGIVRYVLESGDPFVVNMAHGGKVEPIQAPMSTIATEKGGCRALVAPTLVQAAHGEGRPGGTQRWGSGAHDIRHPVGTVHAGGGSFAVAAATLVQTGYGERDGQAPRSLDIEAPLGTIVAGGVKHALASAYLMQANGGFNTTPGHDARNPMSTVTNTGSQQQLVTAHLAHLRGNCDARNVAEPLRTVSAGGEHHGLVECTLSREHQDGAERVAAFLMRYYGEGGQWSDPRDPMTTVTTKDRMALVTVTIKGTPYVIVDIGLRMLEPRELYRAQDFPDSYIIDHGHDGRRFSKSAQVRMCGNSVDPMMAVGFLRLNAPWMAVRRAAA
ncbi:DNA cytosine methyltransferase [Denitromonas sp.]|uniref:DNA cytosine methyltransferase n=1 Tax=Denitromonas sp. TaxID=2734609 RepID=UPI003A8C14F8